MKAFIFLLLIGVSSSVLAAEGTKSDHFSAKVITKAMGQTMEGKFYVSGNKTRMESPANVVIIRPDKEVAWLLIPSQKAYLEQPMDPKQPNLATKAIPGETKRKEIGTETIAGKLTKKMEVTGSIDGHPILVYQWVLDELPIPVKMQSSDGSWSVEYQDVETAIQPDSLFELPADYKKTEMPPMPEMPADLPTEPPKQNS